jgi:hypothetical protein
MNRFDIYSPFEAARIEPLALGWTTVHYNCESKICTEGYKVWFFSVQNCQWSRRVSFNIFAGNFQLTGDSGLRLK